MIGITALFFILAAIGPIEEPPATIYLPSSAQQLESRVSETALHLIEPAIPTLPSSAEYREESLRDTLPLTEEWPGETQDKYAGEPQALSVPPPKEVYPIQPIEIDLHAIFAAAPLIYSSLLFISISACAIWVYHMLLMRKKCWAPGAFEEIVENHLGMGNWQEALALCRQENNLLATVIQAAISARHEGSQAMLERMQMEGRQATGFFWHRLTLLNDIALIAPMIGLLGTVLGMFYAFYDVNRSIDSMYALFDGLGIAVGTTVAGLLVAILSLFFHATFKYRLLRQLNVLEVRAQKIALNPNVSPAQNPPFAMEDADEFDT
jgi:biopolymer transport protein ExbB